MKSGMLAAEAAQIALDANEYTQEQLMNYDTIF